MTTRDQTRVVFFVVAVALVGVGIYMQRQGANGGGISRFTSMVAEFS